MWVDIINMVIDRVPIYQLQIWSMWHLETSTYPFQSFGWREAEKKIRSKKSLHHLLVLCTMLTHTISELFDELASSY
jgi:hypothetical protein